MTLRSYYRWTLLLPYVVPIPFVVWAVTVGVRHPLSGFLVVGIAVSPLFGGLQFAAFALAISRWMRGKTDRQVWRAVLVSPLLFAPVLVVTLLAVFAIKRDWVSGEMELVFGFVLPFELGLGYAYVALAELGRVVLMRSGVVRPTAMDPWGRDLPRGVQPSA